jgi:PKD repeat protein
MKKLLLLLLIPSFVFSQSWIDKMQDPTENFYDTQKEFEDFWENKTIEKGKGWKQFKRWENFIKPRVFPDGLQHPEILAQEYKNLVQANNQFLMLPPNVWTQVGPDDVPLQSNGTKRGIGRVNTIAFHPTDANKIYVGAPAGGFWKSNNGGQTWTTTTDFLTNLGVSDIAINPSNPDEIYIITGDRDGGDTYSYGLMKSLDGGLTFSATGLSFNVTSYYKGNRVLIDPSNTTTIIVATSNGIYRSMDAGVSFVHTYPGINMTDIEFHTTNSNIVYGASKGSTSVYKSSDNGVSWIQAGIGLPSTNDVVRACVAVTPANPQVVYAMFGDNNNGFYGVYKSINEGATWTQESNSPNLLGWSSTGSDSDGQAWYDLAFAVSPTNENILFVGGVNTWKSTNGGQSWNINTHWTGSGGADYMHADEHMLKYNPLNGNLYSGNDGGLYYTTDEVNWTDISDGLHITQFYSLGVSQSVQNKVITGAQDNGTFLKTNTTWDAVIGGDGMECIIDYTNSNIMYGEVYYGAIRKSTNGGNSFSSIAPSNNGSWETPYELDKNNPEIIYAGYDEIYKSNDGGDNWSIITNGETNGGKINEIGISKSNPDVIYFTDDANVFRTTNGGSSWTQINNNLPYKYISYIVVNPNDENTVWVTFSGYTSGEKVYKSIDGGNSWINISGTLPNLPVNCIELDKTNNLETVYIGTDLGVFTSDSTLNDWNVFNNNSLPNVIVNELEIQYQSNTLFAATYGRGLWSIDLQITSPPIADFSYNDSIFCNVPSDVTFMNNSYYSNSYYWDFGDGNTSTATNPTHSYTTFGLFTVQLIATGPLGQDSVIKQQIISVDANNPCIVSLPISGAGNTQTMCNGTLYDVGGPSGNYYDMNDCWITIAPPGSNQITLNFNSFDVEAPSSSTNCNWDYLEIFDGLDTTATSLGQYCNVLTGSPGTIVSSSGAITILLHSDQAVNGSGFEADWTCSFPTAPPVSYFEVSDSVSCNSVVTFTDFSTNGPTTWLWNFGDGNSSSLQNPTHNYLASGTYNVSLITTNTYGSDTVVINNAIDIIDVNLQVTGVTSCGSSSVTLTSNSSSGDVNWYSDNSLQNFLGSGSTYITPVLNTTTSYFAQSVYEFNNLFGGPADNTIGAGSYFQGSKYLIFDNYTPSILVSVLVYANSDAYRTIELRNSSNAVLQDTTVFIPTSPNGIRIYVNFDMPVQNNMQLGLSGSNNDMYRTSSGAVFPYNISNIASITGTNAPAGYYYFFYDWEVKKESCISNITTVDAIIENETILTQNISICNGESIVIGSNTYNTQGTYVDSFLTTNGCDSILTTNLSVGAGIQYFQNFNFCSGQGIQVGTNYYTTTGIYIDTIGLSGCDSIIITDLVVSTPLTVTNNQTICQGEVYDIGSNTYYAPGSYFDVLQTPNGCDSVVNTLLTVLPPAFYYNYVSLCDGESVSVGANTYNSSGNYIDTLSSNNSCDSVVSTEVSLSYLEVEIILINNALQANTLLGNPTSYLWNTVETTSSIQINGAGDYWMIATDANDCISDTVFYTVIHSLIDNLFASGFNIYPNPTTGIVNIEFVNISEDTKVKLYNVLGEIIAEKIVVKTDRKTTMKVDLSSFAKGIYFVELESEKSIVNRKLILR